MEKHEFCFDAVLDEHVTNDEVAPSISYLVDMILLVCLLDLLV